MAVLFRFFSLFHCRVVFEEVCKICYKLIHKTIEIIVQFQFWQLTLEVRLRIFLIFFKKKEATKLHVGEN